MTEITASASERDAVSERTVAASSSVLSPDALLVEVARHYPFIRPVSCRLLRAGQNDTYRVYTETSPYILRVYGSRWRSLSEITYELELLRHLAREHVSVAVPLAAVGGEWIRTLRAPEGTRHMVLFTYANGSPLVWNARHAYLAGRAVARIHAASKNFTRDQQRHCFDVCGLVDSPLEAIGSCRLDSHDEWMYLQKVAERFRKLLVTLADSGLDWGVCHSDIGNDNLLLTKEEEVTAIDFDLAGPGWLAWDFVSARSRASYYEDEGIWHSFVLGYSEVRRIAECDLAAVSLLGAIRRLWSMGMRARLVRLRGDTHFSSSYISREVAFFRRWESRYELAD